MTAAMEHWRGRLLAEQSDGGSGRSSPALTVAISREAGANGALVARAVAERLGWPLYDQELLRRIADEMGIRASLLASVDERRKGWLEEALESFTSTPSVNANTYVRRLIETLFALAARGECVIVGRGAAQILPASTTLRVRLVAPWEDRVQTVRQRERITSEEAGRRVAAMDRDRAHFVQEHFRKDLTNPHGYDLVLNTARFSVEGCADLILEAVGRFEARLRASAPAPVACGAGIV
jgi:cytidylate kinase